MVKASAMTNDVVDKSTDHTKPPLIYFLTIILILKLILLVRDHYMKH